MAQHVKFQRCCVALVDCDPIISGRTSDCLCTDSVDGYEVDAILDSLIGEYVPFYQTPDGVIRVCSEPVRRLSLPLSSSPPKSFVKWCGSMGNTRVLAAEGKYKGRSALGTTSAGIESQ